MRRWASLRIAWSARQINAMLVAARPHFAGKGEFAMKLFLAMKLLALG
jgi:hypothetical protein